MWYVVSRTAYNPIIYGELVIGSLRLQESGAKHLVNNFWITHVY